MKEIVVLQPHLDQATAIAKYLKEKGDNIRVVGGHWTKKLVDQGFRSRYYDEIRSFNTTELVERCSVGEVMPTGSRSTRELVSIVGKLRMGEMVFERNGLIAHDKVRMLEAVKKLGIPVPVTYLERKDVVSLPVFYKSAFEGRHVRGIVSSWAELERVISMSDMILQEYIDTPCTYGVGVFAKDGNIIASFQHKELISIPRTGGSGVVLERISDDRLLEYTRRIVSDVFRNGWGLAEFKFCRKRNDFVFMEFNAKLWASIEFALMNQGAFLKQLFDIEYDPIGSDRVIYLDRLATLGNTDYLVNFLRYGGSTYLNFISSMFTLVSNFKKRRGDAPSQAEYPGTIPNI